MAATAPDGKLRSVLLAVLFGSGFVALVYEVMWLRALRNVFGSGAYATATTLAVFFTGLAIGSHFFGRRASLSNRPLFLYAWLELFIAATGLLYFALPPAHLWIHRNLVGTLGENGPAFAFARVALAFVFLLPSAFFGGGTLPVMVEVFVRRRGDLATTTALLYATNTAGAASGVLVAGFWLPLLLGFRASYAMAIALSLTLGGVALAAASPRRNTQTRPPPASDVPSRTTLPRWLATYAFVGGFATLALEVLWTRMFALVLDSSVYAFATILVVFLVALALGAAFSARLVPRLSAELHLFALLLGAGLAVTASPFALHAATGQLGSIPIAGGFATYVGLAFGTALLVILPPAALCGAVLPCLLRFCEDGTRRPGKTTGTILAFNTIGGVLGSLVAGFGLLPTLGLWRSVSIFAWVYLGLALFAVRAQAPGARQLRPAVLVAAVLVGTFLDPARLPLVRTDVGEHVEHVWETPRGIVAVTHDARGRRIRLDNTYVLGGTEGLAEEQLQARLPLALHPAPRRVFFLGLGTGITAATALRQPVTQVTATELLPEVVEASRTYFDEEAGALFSDDRARVVATDGRIYLTTNEEKWDVIVSDLFLPWHEGAGSLYTKEHFEIVRARLAPGGLFAQWLPFFQLSRTDFDTIARTLLEVFGEVGLWHADLRGGQPVAALVAFRGRPTVPPPNASEARFAGWLPHELFAAAAVNTDDHPVLEHRAPLSRAAVRSGRGSWLTGPELERLLASIATPTK